jgi:hypothetical protein
MAREEVNADPIGKCYFRGGQWHVFTPDRQSSQYPREWLTIDITSDDNYMVLMRLGMGRQVPISSIKEEVKKKHLCNGWTFSCFAAHLTELDLF